MKNKKIGMYQKSAFFKITKMNIKVLNISKTKIYPLKKQKFYMKKLSFYIRVEI